MGFLPNWFKKKTSEETEKNSAELLTPEMNDSAETTIIEDPENSKTPVDAEEAKPAAEIETEEDTVVAEIEEEKSPLPVVAEPLEQEAETKNQEASSGFFAKMLSGLTKTRQNITGKLGALISRSRALDDEFYEELEEILLQADVGVTTTMELMQTIQKSAAKQKLSEPGQILSVIQEEISRILLQESDPMLDIKHTPSVFMLVGVNGAGKTTSIAKLGYRLQQDGKKVLLVAADTFRAAAIDQLQVWADRIHLPLIKREEGADPGAVVFDAMQAARQEQYDVVLIDTAGRLQNKTNLMQEIAKLKKIIAREIPEAPHEVLLVLDATTGQNALGQAKQFMEATGITGIILTKLDGTAKGGIVIAIAHELKIPVKLIGIGEAMDDLKIFHAGDFSKALFNEEAN